MKGIGRHNLYIFISFSLIFTAFIGVIIAKRQGTSNEMVPVKDMKPAISNPFPGFFFSHGGPSFMYEGDKFGNEKARRMIEDLGALIKTQWKPDYIVVVSAHWQSSGPQLVEIGVPKAGKTENRLIYDFYGFPDYMYRETFRSHNSNVVASEVKSQLEGAGFSCQFLERGLDHGVWVPFKVAFLNHNLVKGGKTPLPTTLDLPETSLIQISLTADEKDFELHYRLGKALNFFRHNLIWDETRQKYLKGMVICSGMSVHNLGDLGTSLNSLGGGVMPYVKPFNQLLASTLQHSSDLLQGLKSIQDNHSSLLYQAHPTLEHFVPIVVAAGLAAEKLEPIKELYNDSALSLGWGIYQFGEDYN